MGKLAFIGGTGVYDPGILKDMEMKIIETPFGKASYIQGFFMEREVYFLARHGVNHSVPPHKVNYRANIYALKMLGVSSIVSTTAVGSLNNNYKPGELVLIDQFLDMTKTRENTFFDGIFKGVAHLDMTEPYCNTLGKEILHIAQEKDIVIHPKGTYICTEGPRFETPAEIKVYKMWGADVVGMTNVPEAQLAREAEICYATVSMVTNFAAGISETVLTHKEVLECMSQNSENFRTLITALCRAFDSDEDCSCRHAAADFGGFIL